MTQASATCRILRWMALPVALALPLSCGPAPDGSAPDGSGGAAEAVWSLGESPEVAIGLTDGAPEYLFQDIVGGRLLGDGRIVVADRGTRTLRVFDDQGSFLREMGGSGEGPGEFSYLGRLSVTPSDTILVYDPEVFRLTRFLPDGTLIGALSIIPGEGRPEVFLGTFSNGDLGFAWLKPYSRPPDAVTVDSMGLGRFGADGQFKSRLAEVTGMHRFRSPLPFSPRLHAMVVADSIVMTDGVGPDLTVLDGRGEAVRSFGVATEPIDPAEAWADLRAELDARAAGGEENRMGPWLETVPEEGPIPSIAEVLLDDEGYFWLKRYDPRSDSWLVGGLSVARGGSWWIVDPAAGLIATIRLPDDLTPLDVRRGRLLGVSRDDLGIQRVVLYRVSKG